MAETLPEPAASGAACGLLALPEELSIYTVGGQQAAWLAWLADQRDEVLIDASAVAQIDAAGVQLLAALLRSLDARALGWRVQGAGGALRDAFHTLGLSTRLDHAPAA
jgi:anti-anti-sigma regulatory factor